MNAEAVFYRGKATADFEMRQWKAAQANFQKAVEADPQDAESWVGWGLSLAMDCQLYPGLQVIESCLEKHPDYTRAQVLLGLLYMRMGVTHKSKACLQKALEMDPTEEERQLIESQLGARLLKVSEGGL